MGPLWRFVVAFASMTDHDVPTAPDEDGPGEEDTDREIPLFWGFLLVVAVVVIAVLLFRGVDLVSGSSAGLGEVRQPALVA